MPQASIKVEWPIPRNLPRNAASALRAGKLATSAALCTVFRMVNKSPMSYSMITGGKCGKVWIKLRRHNSAGFVPISHTAVSVYPLHQTGDFRPPRVTIDVHRCRVAVIGAQVAGACCRYYTVPPAASGITTSALRLKTATCKRQNWPKYRSETQRSYRSFHTPS